jgi:hypothetical protein
MKSKPLGISVPLTSVQIRAAGRIHQELRQWRDADAALRVLRDRCPDFGLESALLKVVAINSLYGTNLFAIHRMAAHVSMEMGNPDALTVGPELVERIACMPKGGTEKKAIRRHSFASKFAHFFVNEDRFPIYDSYAVKMIRFHLGATAMSRSAANPYLAYVESIEQLSELSQQKGRLRDLDRYLWIAGQYRSWRRDGEAPLNGELKALFKNGHPDLRLLPS